MELNFQNLKSAFISGYHNIYNYYPQINKLNVFPVPDGDTGINMNLTVQNGVENIKDLTNGNLKDIGERFSRGLIMGARGNSGVIFSQILRGFTQSLTTQETIKTLDLVVMLSDASKIAYKAVMTPVEGTILTVIREISEHFTKLPKSALEKMSMVKAFQLIVQVGNKSLDNTPNLLPVLKEVGVVDSGGFGLMKFFEGVSFFLENNKILEKLKKHKDVGSYALNIQLKKEYGYCTEVIVTGHPKTNIGNIRQILLDQKCTSIVAVQDSEILKVHAHTLQPGVVLTFLQQFGDFLTVKIDNMTLQAKSHSQSFATDRELLNPWAIIPIVPSREMADYFKKTFKINCSIIAGKFMNPAVEAILDKIKEVDANNVYLLPNNSNTILAAEHAAKMETVSSVHVVPSKNICEGIVSMFSFNSVDTPRRNLINMKQGIRSLKTVSISKAARLVSINNVKVNEHDYFAVLNGRIIVSSPDLQQLLTKVVERMVKTTSEVVTVLHDQHLNQDNINWLQKYLDESYDVEYEFINVGDNVNELVIAIE